MYYIYHVPGEKIGCTDNIERRVVRQQGYTNYEILEEHTDIYEASYREIELQEQYGYPVDTKPYYKLVHMHTEEARRKMSNKKTGTTVPQERRRRIQMNRHSLSPIQVKEIRDLYDTGNYSFRALSRKYNVHHQTIGNVINKDRGY